MGKNYEIERKFLVEFPDVAHLDVKRRISIVQTYLKKGVNGSQRRVRYVEENGKVKYTYTEKVFITPVTREENEYEISQEEYRRLLSQERGNCPPVEKVRYCFEYNSQLFELDKYPFSDELAIMELELGSPEQKIDFPDNVKVLREVSDDARYSNASLASAGGFPEQKIGENI
ncbi:MAG: CYTH domain-containing protein [Ruminococcus sp.]|uniref:CYTH domain-containing protein n=1 Tax=Ruminococcus sp. TaxID=41978 RepID=UPI0025E60B62|nr:CYTH domain-containing protein [Ruminococcus sp.]MCR5600044.1 CYTH domain-containing protein [Ruminococcus sp.]